MDEAAKAARRSRIMAELTPLRTRLSENINERNRLVAQLERLRPARSKLSNYIDNALIVARDIENCYQRIPDSRFKGERRLHLIERLDTVGSSFSTQCDRHHSNLGRLDRYIRAVHDRQETLTGTIRSQNNRIATLEAELRTLR